MARKHRSLIITILLITFICAGQLQFAPNVSAREIPKKANVLLFSGEGQSPLIRSLGIDQEAISITIITNDTISAMSLATFNGSLGSADVLFVDRYLPDDPASLALIAGHVNGSFGNAGLVMFGFHPDDDGFAGIDDLKDVIPVELVGNISGQLSTDDTGDAGYKVQVGTTSPVPAGSTAITRHIGWTSCPAISRRLVIDARPGASKVVEAVDFGYEGDSILSEWDVPGGGHVMFYSTILDQNKPFYLWPYFNYLMYVSVFHSMAGYPDSAIESYADWPHAPIPSTLQGQLWFVLVGGMAAATITITVHFKRRGDAEKRTDGGGDRGE